MKHAVCRQHLSRLIQTTGVVILVTFMAGDIETSMMAQVVADPLVAEMIRSVRQSDLEVLLRRICGAEPIIAGGNVCVLLTRHTQSAASIRNATQAAFEHLQALGPEVYYQNWLVSGTPGRNVVRTLPGSSRSNELVLVTAHLDDQPAGALAPGADDNASGVVAVLTAAEVFSVYRFERTVRFVLFTGEEQGHWGSAAYASQAATNGENIVAVLNLDVLAYNSTGSPTLHLHIRSPSNPGYSLDLPIASVFPIVVSTYGLGGSLTPVIDATEFSSSDHASFWQNGYPAVFASEHLWDDKSPYWHTTNDTIETLNLPYYTAFIKACLGTLAHLAIPTGKKPTDVIEIVNSDWSTNSGIGAGVFYARHETGATETGIESRDTAWTNVPANSNAIWLKIHSEPYGAELQTDSRPTNSESIFNAKLSVVDTKGAGTSCANRLRFAFLTPPDANRIYTLRVHVDGHYTEPSIDFEYVTNLLEVIDNGGYLDLPNLRRASNGTVYGTCEIAARSLSTDRGDCRLRVVSAGGSSVVLAAATQAGARVIDEVEVNPGLGQGSTWTVCRSSTNYLAPTAATFDTGWGEVLHVIDTSAYPPASTRFFRLHRTWIPR